MLTPNQWHPPRDISGPDQESLVQFQRDLAYGDGCFPAGANGRGLYPAESRPLLERGEEVIRDARARGVEGRAELIHFPHRDDVQHFLEQSGGQGQLFQFDNSFPDVVVVLFTK
jgi:hypothetical protein